MNYIDTDVLIHSLVNQNPGLHLKVNDLIEKMIVDDTFLISWLNIQEVGFVLAKLDQPADFISAKLMTLMSSLPVAYGSIEFTRALELAKTIGFKDFNDCIHTAIAEQHCSGLYTYNYKDFKRIQPYTSLNIHFL
ncbi:type II toxin-antitoxin system VapC family toxin [Olivibacter sitiensis]|uniref:type II toxin-antitoxin system VapC family toxin n=1 Tax=Olivibacter sitiensis TaxID=376470 RepID=UPI0004834375|nr:PIN domain-containing protein [Olivibacter sitiensis]